MEFIQTRYPGYRKNEFNKVILPKLTINDLAKLLEDYKNTDTNSILDKKNNKNQNINKKVVILSDKNIKAPDDTKGKEGVITHYNPNNELPYTVKFKQRYEGDYSWDYKVDEFEILG